MKKVEKEIKWQQKLIRGKLSFTFLIFSTCQFGQKINLRGPFANLALG
jgi:hypothetical protein